MITIRQTGNLTALAAQIRTIPTKVLPYAASSAATASAQEAKKRIVEEMPRRFDRPTPYALNALRVVPSQVKGGQASFARVAVKDQVGGTGIAPEKFLEPEVDGGLRGEKRYEKAMRFAGVLRSGEVTVPGAGAPLDAYGNLSAATIRSIMSQLGALVRNGQTVKARRLKRGAGGERREYFLGEVGAKRQRGIWLREGRSILPILMFVRRQPLYRGRLDFTGIAESATRDTFAPEFQRVAAELTERFAK